MTRKNNDLTFERLRALFHYDPDSGQFKRLVRTSNCIKAGDFARGTNGKGRLRISIDGARYLGSRLAWLYMTGEWPERDVDHRNLYVTDNRWDNLRLASSSQNAANKRKYKNASPLPKGVSYHKQHRKFTAVISVDGKPKHLGLFQNPEDAHAAYCAAAKERYGDFARVA